MYGLSSVARTIALYHSIWDIRSFNCMYIFISVFTAQSLCLSLVQILIRGFREIELIILGLKTMYYR